MCFQSQNCWPLSITILDRVAGCAPAHRFIGDKGQEPLRTFDGIQKWGQ
jgi:hypothetical protein